MTSQTWSFLQTILKNESIRLQTWKRLLIYYIYILHNTYRLTIPDVGTVDELIGEDMYEYRSDQMGSECYEFRSERYPKIQV